MITLLPLHNHKPEFRFIIDMTIDPVSDFKACGGIPYGVWEFKYCEGKVNLFSFLLLIIESTLLCHLRAVPVFT
jgi:hypothetical protein